MARALGLGIAVLLGLVLACAQEREAETRTAPAPAASAVPVAAHRGDAPSACQTAADCHGMLPHHCMQCADGTSACAHYDCVQGHCEVVTCPAPADAGSQ